jgi:uncharacterized protein involved in exopolysaccharide biosynthesis
VRRAAVAQAIIAVATTQDRAAAVVGDLLEEESGGRVRFWQSVAGTTLAFAWLNIVRFIFRRPFAAGADNRGQVVEFWRFLWRRKWLVVVPVVLSTMVATVVAYRIPVLYRSEAKVIVVPQRVPVSLVPASLATKLEDRLAAIRRQIFSRTRLERIVTEFNLYEQERKTALMEEIVQWMRERDLGVETMPGGPDRDPATFTVSFQSTDQRVAMRVTERLVSLFIEENLVDRSRMAENTHNFLAGQLDELARQVDELAAAIESDRQAHRTPPRSRVIEFEELQNTYRELLGKRGQARIAASLEANQIGETYRVIDPARIPERPEGPDRLSIALFGSGVGLVAGLLLILVASMRPPTPPPPMAVPAASPAAEST